MLLNLYAVYDVVSESVSVLGTSTTDGAFIRQNLPYLEKINPNFKTDLQIRKIGTIDDTTCVVAPCEHTIVDWNTYNVPEKKIE
ncbi:MAG TPA: hypothetical protein DDW20_02355 [Firmicutes bacterium]|nr:hypothetical protein [Bacillota bacterium]